MKVERIKYSKHYHPINPGEWIGMDVILEDGDTALTAFADARKICDAAYAQNNAIAPPEINIIQTKKEEKYNGDLSHDISTCEELTVLQSYYLLMTTTHKHLMPVYEERKRQLVENESKEILKKTEEHTKSIKQK